jgi:hypothetical protein
MDNIVMFHALRFKGWEQSFKATVEFKNRKRAKNTQRLPGSMVRQPLGRLFLGGKDGTEPAVVPHPHRIP